MTIVIDEYLAAVTGALRGMQTDHNRAELLARIMLAKRQGWKCTRCGQPIMPEDIGAGRTHKDQVIPISAGGPREEWNIDLLHDRCNESKRARMTRRAYALAAEHRVPVPPPDPGPLYRAIVTVFDSLDTLDRALEDLEAAGALVPARDWAAAMPHMSRAVVQASTAAEVIAAHATTTEPAAIPAPTWSEGPPPF